MQSSLVDAQCEANMQSSFVDAHSVEAEPVATYGLKAGALSNSEQMVLE